MSIAFAAKYVKVKSLYYKHKGKEMTAYTFYNDLLAEIKTVPEDGIVSRSLEKNEAFNVTLFAFASGQALTEHTAPRPAILHFLAGEATLTLGEDTKEVHAGAWAYMPANLPHSIEAQTNVTMLLIMTRS